MSDLSEIMKRKIEDAKRANPNLDYRFVDSRFPERVEIDGWKPVTGKSVDGKEKVNELMLVGRPKDEREALVKQERARTRSQLTGISRRFANDIRTAGGGGRYLAPLSESDIRISTWKKEE